MKLFFYKARIESVYDGDTLSATIDVGFGLSINVKIRLAEVNTPEIRGVDKETKKKGLEARDFVRNLCLNQEVFINTVKKDKYGRYLAEIWHIENNKKSEKSLSELLIENGLAEKYN